MEKPRIVGRNNWTNPSRCKRFVRTHTFEPRKPFWRYVAVWIALLAIMVVWGFMVNRASATTLGDRWRALPAAEKVYQAERLIDIGMTLECLHNKPGCRETNPFLGHHPSDAKLIGVSMAFSALHLGATMALNDRNPHAAKVFATVSAVAGAGIIGLNLRVRFK